MNIKIIVKTKNYFKLN